jgi:diguanylate cyclase (GGDEF)-like protein
METMTEPGAAEAEEVDLAALRRRRFRIISKGCAVALTFLVGQFALGGSGRLCLIVLVVLAALVASMALERRGRLRAGVYGLISVMTLSIFGFMVTSEGVHDFSLVVFPLVLVIGSLLLDRRAFVVLLAVITVGTLAMVGVEMSGSRPVRVDRAGIGTMLDIVLVMSVTAIATWTMARDWQDAIRKAVREADNAKAAQAQLARLATHDPLTALPNRTLARTVIDAALKDLAALDDAEAKLAILFLDLDNFKQINDSLGHLVGDELLQGVAARLSESIGPQDFVCRFGGDEFVVLVPRVTDLDVLRRRLLALIGAVNQPFRLSGNEVHSSVSIGVSVAPDNSVHFDQLLQMADTALYAAKDAGSGTYRFFDIEMKAAVAEQLTIRNGLLNALERRELSLHVQPKVDCFSRRLTGVEVLLRWSSPTLGQVPPVKFIPVAETSGQIVAIGTWVLEQACRQGVAWQEAGLEFGTIAVNLSAMQFRGGDLAAQVADILARTGFPADRLELELTESILLSDAENVRATCVALRRLGVRLSIDDFGTGYSSLSYLRRFPVDVLKIDRSFLTEVTQNPADLAIVAAVIRLSHDLGLEVVAEGVETEAVAALLGTIACDQMQGYLLARPMPAADFPAWAEAAARSPAVVPEAPAVAG